MVYCFYCKISSATGVTHVVVAFTQGEEVLVENNRDVGLYFLNLVGDRSGYLGTVELDLFLTGNALVLIDQQVISDGCRIYCTIKGRLELLEGQSGRTKKAGQLSGRHSVLLPLKHLI